MILWSAGGRQSPPEPGQRPRPGHVLSLYSTVTVLARFRGWLTFRPLARAIP